MRKLIPLLALIAAPAAAQDFAEGSQANSWGLLGEQKARFEAEVVDLLCTLAGDCPENCGGGARQLGLMRSDGVLVLPMKNGQPLFTGAVVDLLPYCGQTVEVDGLLIGEPEATDARFYMVQSIRAPGSDGFVKADRFTEEWAAANPTAAEGDGAWYLSDPGIQAEIEAHGYLGLGHEADAAFIADWF